MFRIFILDSDPYFRKEILGFLSKDQASWNIEECKSGLEAIPALRNFKPDLFVCEAEAPGVDGFSLLETMSPDNRPATIFISHQDQFAARAFEYSAIDYLVKPVNEDRFLQAIKKAKHRMEKSSSSDQQNQKKLAIKNGRSIIFIKPEELDWVDAEGKHVRLHIGKEMLFLKMSISALEQELNPLQFVRIHRSTIVNVDRVRLIQPCNHRRAYQVTLQDGTRLILSRRNKLRAMSGKTISLLDEVVKAGVHSTHALHI
jgi:two-component system, LytTR family, response regulator